jgi:hypothetical protein
MSARGMLVLVVLLSAGARADDLQEAREHYRKATRAYELGLYDEAIQEYTAAYKAKDDPAILYNMAQAQRLGDHPADALRLYRMYLIRVPDAANRAEVVGRIDTLQKLLDQQKAARTTPPDTTLPPKGEETPALAPPSPRPEPVVAAPPARSTAPSTDAHPGRGLTLGGIALAVVGVAAVAGGVACGALAKKNADDLSKLDEAMGTFQPSKESAGKNEQVAEGVLIGVGAVAAVTGVVLVVLGRRAAHRPPVALLPSVGAKSAGATLRWAF